MTCVGIFVVSCFLYPRGPSAWFGGWTAFAIGFPLIVAGFFFVVAYAQISGLRCPACRGPWSTLAFQTRFGGSPFSIDDRIRYCPYCGRDIDAKGGHDSGIGDGSLS